MPRLTASPSRIPGNLTIGGNITLTGGGDITGDGAIRLLPTGAYITQIGDAGSTSHTLNTNDDLFVSGRLEVDGYAYCDGVLTLGSYLSCMLGSSGGVGYGYTQVYDWADNGHFVAVAGTDGWANHHVVITSYGNRAKNHGLGTPATNPTLKIFSATDPTGDTTQHLDLSHNASDGSLYSAKGGQHLHPADGTVYFDSAAQVSKAFGLKVFHQTVTLDTGDAETAVGLDLTSSIIFAAAIRVSTQVTGLDSADHHLKLGLGGSTDRFCDASQGGAATTIDVNKKDYYQPSALEVGGGALILTIDGGADNIPSAGAVEVYVLYSLPADLPSV